VKPILARFWVFLAASTLVVVGSVALHAAGQDSAGSAAQQVPDGSLPANGKTESPNDAASNASSLKDAASNASSLKDAAGKDPDGKPDGKAKSKSKSKAKAEPEFVRKTDAEWRKILTRTQYMVTRQKATEPAFSGAYATGHFRGMFLCVCCDAELFSAQSKFDSGTGWPSFDRPASAKSIARAMDYDALEPRIEVTCRRCGAHLGHVFDDGPTVTTLRFCINSASLKLKPPEGESAPTKSSSRTAASRSSKARAKAKMTKANSKVMLRSKSKATQPPSDSQESPGPSEADRPAEQKAAPAAKPSE
jgi:peptide-methionine (R)-S-oxide reductase